MKRIYKYLLDLSETMTIEASIVRPLSIQIQNGKLCLWAEVEHPNSTTSTLIITTVGTGRPVPETAGMYLCTVQQGGYVWHFYWRLENDSTK